MNEGFECFNQFPARGTEDWYEKLAIGIVRIMRVRGGGIPLICVCVSAMNVCM